MIALIILAYVANVFLNRWLDKMLVKKLGSYPIPWFWFCSLFATATLLFALIIDNKLINWFTGKHW